MILSVAVIPARGGSVRLPSKNILPFHGKPLIAHSIELCRGYFNRTIVSTDDDEIAAIASQYGAEVFRRPADDGTTGTQEVTRLALLGCNTMDCNVAACVYATAPLLLPEDLKRARNELYYEPGMTFAMAVGAAPLRDAGAFYMGWRSGFVNREPLIGPDTMMIVLPEERVCDINDAADFHTAECLYREMHPESRGTTP